MSLSYRAKVLVDHTLGLVAALAFKCAAKVLSVVLRRDHSTPEDPGAIVVAKLAI